MDAAHHLSLLVAHRLAPDVNEDCAEGAVVVCKAVLPVAGLGTRSLPATKAVPKELLPIVGKPASQYFVDECGRAGLDEVLFVISVGKSSLEGHFDRLPGLEPALAAKGKQTELRFVVGLAEIANIHSVRQPEPL